MTDKRRPPIVILVDELDQLCTKKQEVRGGCVLSRRFGVLEKRLWQQRSSFQLIYDIFNWTSVESARVSVMAIANTLDLPERMLSQRITSRIVSVGTGLPTLILTHSNNYVWLSGSAGSPLQLDLSG